MVNHIKRRVRGFIHIRQKMLEQEQQHIPDAAVRTGGDDELPLTARNQACRAFKTMVSFRLMQELRFCITIGKIAFHDITLIQLGNAQLEALRGMVILSETLFIRSWYMPCGLPSEIP